MHIDFVYFDNGLPLVTLFVAWQELETNKESKVEINLRPICLCDQFAVPVFCPDFFTPGLELKPSEKRVNMGAIGESWLNAL